MSRRLPIWLAALAVVAATVGCRPGSKTTAMSEHPLLWAAQKDGQTTYLLGTMHIGFNAEKQLPSWVWDKVKASKSFAIETDISDPALMQTGLRRDGTTLRDELGEDYWKKLEAELGPATARSALRMTPASVSSLLEIKGMPPAMPMDLMLLGEAESSDKKLVYLEPAATQIALLDKWVDVRALKAALDERAAGTASSSKQLLAAYVAGDVKRLEAMGGDREAFTKTGRTEAEYDQMMNELLYARNASWIPAIEKMHAEGSAMVAVGAMHLLGKRSVLDLLQQRGFQIARVGKP
jgi:uncharacterized protein